MIERTITVVWNGTDWRDKTTGVLIEGLAPPMGDRLIGGEPQFVEAGRFKTLHPTHEEVQQMIDDAFQKRVIPDLPPYMMSGDWLVSYKWLQREGDYRQSRIDDLQRQINQLQRPWWKKL